jgi:hypothetical protein
MLRILVGALLAACVASPAGAGLFIEMRGQATTYLIQADQSWKKLHYSTARLSGYCGYDLCTFEGFSGGFLLSASAYHAIGYDFSFFYDDPAPADPRDGQWHDGEGGGLASGGYIAPGYEVTAIGWQRARLVVDDQIVWGDQIPGISYSGMTPVPEPATWALLVAGFALAGGALRRRRGVAAGLPAR